MIENVNQGDKITAVQQNKIIDSVNNLAAGVKDVNNYGSTGKQISKSSYSCMFQVKQARGYRLQSRPSGYSDSVMTTTWMQIGANISDFKKNAGLPSDGKVYLLNSSNQAAQGEITDEWLKVNGTDAFYDGWIDLQYGSRTPVYAIRCTVANKETHTPIGTYFAIDSSSSKDSIENNLLDLLGLDSETYQAATDIFVVIADYTSPGHLKGDSGSGPGYSQLMQMHTGALVAGGEGNTYKADSQLSDLNLSSVQMRSLSGEQYFQIMDFHNLNNNIEPDYSKQDIILRYRDDDGTAVVKYLTLSTLVNDLSGSLISGDSQIEGMTKSVRIEIDGNKRKIVSLYNFDTTAPDNSYIRNIDPAEYYYNGSTKLIPKINNQNAETGYDFPVKNRNTTVNELNYFKEETYIPPFTHGDADDYLGNSTKSIESVIDTANPEFSRYQLLDFDQPTKQTTNNYILSNYVNLANGAEKGDMSDHDDLFLVRDSASGNLTYRKIYAKTDGGNLKERVQNLENNVGIIQDNIVEIYGDIGDLSGKISSLTGDYWEQGGGSNTCYGSSIGDSDKTTAINLDGKDLVGDWTADNLTADYLETDFANAQTVVAGNATVNEDLVVYGQLNLDGVTLNAGQLQQLLALIQA